MSSPLTASLVRGAGTVAEWRDRIEAAGRPAATSGYRSDATPNEALWRVLEDEDAPREARAGAALALRRHLDEDGRTRMRVVAEGCASPTLRIALDAALDEESPEARVLEALEQVSTRRG